MVRRLVDRRKDNDMYFCAHQGFAGPSACILAKGHTGPHSYGHLAAALSKDRERDAERFAYLYSGQKTESNALIEIEMRLLSGDVPTLDEVRAAVDECMRTPNTIAQGREPQAKRPSGAES